MESINYIVKHVISKYKGKYETVTTYILNDSRGKKVCWHDNGRRPFPFKAGDVLKGIIINDKNQINYNKSVPTIINEQLNLF